MLQVKQVTKRFNDGTVALSSIDMNIQAGELVILLGHNGSGKSTLLRTIGGLEAATSGDILLSGESISHGGRRQMRNLRKKMGHVFQKFHLIPNLSVFQNVLFGALGRHPLVVSTLHPFAKKALREKAMSCLERVNLDHLASRRADQLSGGQQQRVAIARMLMQEPSIILADEPIASLDPKAGVEVMDLLIEVAKEQGMTLICTLHQLDLAAEYGNRFVGLSSGRLVMDEKKSHHHTPRSFAWLYEGEKELLENV
ncbi:phosphonate ABC transporter ATP-binding protein [Cytobacillus gottheilii]|uniref:phosphonate ABC transporter ATP-binding protein n=1 Tax=Cytobacillus gottheilii TaxID=859144 RepID=UPI0009BC1296|nr:phosphonate ABC transporter ATP-binding protein [Cytobacillus gottheilii]